MPFVHILVPIMLKMPFSDIFGRLSLSFWSASELGCLAKLLDFLVIFSPGPLATPLLIKKGNRLEESSSILHS